MSFIQRKTNKRLLFNHTIISTKVGRSLPEWLRFASLTLDHTNIIEVVYFTDSGLDVTNGVSFEIGTLVLQPAVGKYDIQNPTADPVYPEAIIVENIMLNVRAGVSGTPTTPDVWHTCEKGPMTRGKFDCPRAVLDTSNRPIVFFSKLKQPVSLDPNNPYPELSLENNYLILVSNSKNDVYFLVARADDPANPGDYFSLTNILRLINENMSTYKFIAVDLPPVFVDEYQMTFAPPGYYKI